MRTVYIMGLPNTGKTTLLISMIRQDILNGKGVAVIDPHGDWSRDLIPYIPKERVKDVVYFDPLVTPIGLNLFHCPSENQKQKTLDDLFLVFKRLTGVDPLVQADAILERALQLLVEVPGSTFTDLYRVMTNDYFRHELLGRVTNPSILEFWKTVWPAYKHPTAELPIVTRMSKFDSNIWLNKVLGSTSRLNFLDLIQKKRIFIANLSKTNLGFSTSAALGTILVSQYQLAAFSQGELPKSQRVPCYLYIDEFQNFKTSAFNEIIIEARKFELHPTFAHQAQKDLDQETKSGVEAMRTQIFFRLTSTDAHKFGREIGKFTADDLLNLPDHHAIIRPIVPAKSKRFEVHPLPPRPKGFMDEIIEHTRKSYPAIVKASPPTVHAVPAALDDDPTPTPFPQD